MASRTAWTANVAAAAAAATRATPGRCCQQASSATPGSGNCEQARLAVTDHAMAHSRRAVPARARPGVLAEAFQPEDPLVYAAAMLHAI